MDFVLLLTRSTIIVSFQLHTIHLCPLSFMSALQLEAAEREAQRLRELHFGAETRKRELQMLLEQVLLHPLSKTSCLVLILCSESLRNNVT